MATVQPLKIDTTGRIKNVPTTDSIHIDGLGLGAAPSFNGLTFGSDALAEARVVASGVDTVGAGLTISSGDGGDSSASAGGSGGALTLSAGAGGDGSAGQAAGAGGGLTISAGNAGAFVDTGTSNGGDLTFSSGAGDGGSGTDGTIDLQIAGSSSMLLSATPGKWFVPNGTIGFTDSANSVYGTQSVLFGHQTDASNQAVAMGYIARAVAGGAVAMGYNTHAGSAGSIAIGSGAQSAFGVSAGNAISLGFGATAQEINGMAIGPNTTVADGHGGSIALGAGSATDSAGQLSIGADGSNVVITDVVIGRGAAGGQQPTSVTIRNSNNATDNLDAGSLTIQAAQAVDAPSGEDAGNGGNLILVGGKGGDGASGFRPGDGGDLNMTAGNGGTYVDIGTSDGGDININAGATVGGVGTDGAINIGTTTAASITFGNATDNPDFTFQGSGGVSFGGSKGTAGQVLTSNGGSAAPTWQRIETMATSSQDTTTNSLTDGDFGYISAANTWDKTDAEVAAKAVCAGAFTGTSGEMVLPGSIVDNAKFTTDGGAPTVGQEVYLAKGSADTSTGAGKLTATAPSGAGDYLAVVGFCLDPANYAGSKTAKVIFAPKAIVQL